MFMCKYERYESGNKVQAITSRLVAVLTITDVMDTVIISYPRNTTTTLI